LRIKSAICSICCGAGVGVVDIGITADTALRLAKLFNTSPEFWLNLQAQYELEMTAAAIAKDLRAIVPRVAA
jgi:plasmid maintenance system antidote protein VapI